MKPIKDYDLINEAGDFKRLPAGIYLAKITDVQDKADREYLEIRCEIAKGEYEGYFGALVAAGLRDSSTHIRSYKTSALPFFKAFITAVEKSNPGYKWDWDERKLIGKYAIAVFGEEEYLDKDGNVKVSVKLQEYRSIEAYKEGKVKVPPLKKLPEDQIPAQQAPKAEEPVDESIFDGMDDLVF